MDIEPGQPIYKLGAEKKPEIVEVTGNDRIIYQGETGTLEDPPDAKPQTSLRRTNAVHGDTRKKGNPGAQRGPKEEASGQQGKQRETSSQSQDGRTSSGSQGATGASSKSSRRG